MFVLYWYECIWVVLACETLHICIVCIWRCELDTQLLCGSFYAPYIHFHSFIQTRRIVEENCKTAKLVSAVLFCFVFSPASGISH